MRGEVATSVVELVVLVVVLLVVVDDLDRK